ncbi:MAG: disulfide bond formation protein B [Pseudomonadota bacterium]
MAVVKRDPSEAAAYRAGGLALLMALGVILAALAFEHIGGYVPCPLCLQQRYAYYAGIPLLFLALALVSAEERRWAALLLFLVALAFLANAGLGVYQAGAEWGYWPGPDTCGGGQAITGNAGNLLEKLATTQVVRCDEAQWRFAGLSFAGWNAVLSMVIFATALNAAFASAIRR